MAHTSNERIQLALLDYGLHASETQCDSIRTYISLLLRWNNRVSLTSITGIDDILRFHFGESLFALNAVPIENGRLADVGSGAGFPGLALKIGHPTLRLSLLEPNLKKAAFLNEVARELHLEDVEVVRSRFEALSTESGQFEYISARALGSYRALVPMAESRLSTSGSLILWLGWGDSVAVMAIKGLRWREPILIPGSKGRFLLIGSRK
jgi:16S rRNA (guanine527-N7)-methyltransferase